MSFEDVRSVKALLGCRPRARAEAANHGASVMRECVPVLVVLSGEAFLVVLATDNRALLRPHRLMCHHVCLQVLELSTAVWVRTSSLALRPLIGRVGRLRRSAGPGRADGLSSHSGMLLAEIVDCDWCAEGVVAM